MGGEVLVHLEHAHLFLAENLPEFIVSQDFMWFSALWDRVPRWDPIS